MTKKEETPIAVAQAVEDLLTALGFDTDDEAIRDTPDRVARAWREMLAGYDMSAADILKADFSAVEGELYDEVVALRGVDFYSACEHHLAFFFGKAYVAYIPEGGRVVGLSKLARLVEMHARRLQLQERMTFDIARDLRDCLSTPNVAVVVVARHMCMCARGVRKNGEMITSRLQGSFRTDPSARAEVMHLFGIGGQ